MQNKVYILNTEIRDVHLINSRSLYDAYDMNTLPKTVGTY